MFKKLLTVASILGFMIAFSVQSATSADAKWQERQQALFEQTGLKAGEVIQKEDWKKVDGLLPSSMVEWLKKGYLPQIKIAEFKYDPAADDEWTNAGLKNAGKYKLDDRENLVEVATGKPPLWIHGIPFPNVDLKNDPYGAMKFMYNRVVNESRKKSWREPFTSEWISDKGLERSIKSYWIEYRYWCKPENEREAQNPARHRYREITTVIDPYDLAGITQLTFRKLDGTEDELYVYIPAIRRVKKMSGANRSDPYMGSDACADDKFGFTGLVSSMKWRVVEEKAGLLCVVDWASEHTQKTRRLPNGTWRTLSGDIGVKVGWQVKGWQGAPWAPVNVVWIPRTFLIIEAIPKDPYYNYGKTVFWIDKETHVIDYKVIWDKAGEYWKTLLVPPTWVEFANKKRVPSALVHIMRDDKANHASVYHHGGTLRGKEFDADFNNPDVNPKMFRVESMRMWSK